jgi:hypothetical protein
MIRQSTVFPSTSLFHRDHLPNALGCAGCMERECCGGLQVTAPLLDCSGLCACEDSSRCQYVCHKHRDYAARIQEVGGFRFDNIGRVQRIDTNTRPAYVPIIFRASARERDLDCDIVAVPLFDLVDVKRSTLRFATARAVRNAFKLGANTRIVLTGVGKDRRVERWWGLENRRAIVRGLRTLGIEFVTVPNFSTFLDVPRPDNLYALKRILIVWQEFMEEGLLAALHINARCDTDYQRLTEFIVPRPEVTHLAAEFTTGAKRADRGRWHADQLCKIARAADRGLTLVIRGGQKWLPVLAGAFGSVVFLDAGAQQRARFRRTARLDQPSKLSWEFTPTAEGEPIDELLERNVALSRRSIEGLLARGRTQA